MEENQPQPEGFKKVLKWLGKIWIIFTSFLGHLLLLTIITSIALLGTSSTETTISEKIISGEGKDKIAVIRLEGVINDEEIPFDPFSGGESTITPNQVRTLLDQAKQDSTVKAVILRINSPGGSAVASDDIYEVINEFKKNKKIIVSIGDIAASGGYYIAAASNKIVANPSSITGSIGVLASIYNLSGLYDKIGVKHEVYKTGQFKDLFSESRERTPQEKELIQNLLDDALNQFISQVASGRGVGEEKIRPIADGRIFSGNDAKSFGLVDEIGNLDKAIEVSKSLANLKEATVVEYSTVGFLDSLFGTKFQNLSLLDLLNPTKNKATAPFSIQYLMDI